MVCENYEPECFPCVVFTYGLCFLTFPPSDSLIHLHLQQRSPSLLLFLRCMVLCSSVRPTRRSVVHGQRCVLCECFLCFLWFVFRHDLFISRSLFVEFHSNSDINSIAEEKETDVTDNGEAFISPLHEYLGSSPDEEALGVLFV